MVEVGWGDVRARRLVRSFLTERAESDRFVEVVGDLCGVHAQVQTAAELQIASRVDGITQTDVRNALWEQRTLVKAWTLRGTLHLHPAAELPLWHSARRAVLRSAGDQGLPAWRDPAGQLHPALGADEVQEVRATVWEVLDGRCLLREELAEAVVKRVGARARERLRSGFAFFLADLCQGPPQGARTTLARPDQWIDGWQEVDEDEALREVCRRFLRTYGPSRPAELCQWLSAAHFKVADARLLFEDLGADLEEIDVEGRRCFVLVGDTSFPASSPNVRLLPEYDVYVMGFRERDRFVPDSVKELIAGHGRGRYEGPAGVRLVLVDGIAAGLWERRWRGERVELDVKLAGCLDKGSRAEIEREAERIGAFLGLEPALSVAS